MDDVSYGNPVGWALLNEEKAGDIYTNKKHSKKVLEEMINFFDVVKTTLILFSAGLGHMCTKVSIWRSERLLCVSWFSTAIQVLGLGRQQGLNLMS